MDVDDLFKIIGELTVQVRHLAAMVDDLQAQLAAQQETTPEGH